MLGVGKVGEMGGGEKLGWLLSRVFVPSFFFSFFFVKGCLMVLVLSFC